MFMVLLHRFKAILKNLTNAKKVINVLIFIMTLIKNVVLNHYMVIKLPDYKCFIHFYIVSQKKTKKPNKDCPISQNYIDVIVLGALKFNHDFAEKIIKSIHYWKGINV